MALEAVRLSGRYVDLVPLRREHHDDLVEAVKDGRLAGVDLGTLLDAARRRLARLMA